ncbi:DUF4007 family protein [Sporosarcina siberiensis]|uniref:DUF4007 family protein n=1 Tax=Sporosarcina siberiensis TaxID=1365606 RepID=A0ABW4SI92_9BACL
MGYNQHQSFFLRERWLGKGLREIKNDPNFFFQSDAFEKIGLGKNMVQSLRYWIDATGAAKVKGTGKNRYHEFQSIGDWVLRNDPAIKHFETAALLHYTIVSNIHNSTTWYWFFNLFSESMSTREDIFVELDPWVQERETRVIAENSIKRDIDCLIRMYTAGRNFKDPEEVNASPFNKLALLKEINGTVYKVEPSIPDGSLLFVQYILLAYGFEHKQYEVSLEDIVHKEGLLGKSFNLSRSTIVGLLMKLLDDPDYPLQFTRTNNLDMVKIPEIDPEEFLRNSSE